MRPPDTAFSAVQTPLDRARRREHLAVLCALDRARLRLLFVPEPARPPASDDMGGDVLKTVLQATRFLPGRIGRWSRRLGLLTVLVRVFR